MRIEIAGAQITDAVVDVLETLQTDAAVIRTKAGGGISVI